MKYTALLAAFALSTLAACSMTGSKPTPDAVATGHAACVTDHPSTKGNFIAQAKCLTASENSAPSSKLDLDLLSTLQTKRLSLAQSADSGLIPPDSYRQQLPKIEAQLATQQLARKTPINVQ